jgi:hypothetical protein
MPAVRRARHGELSTRSQYAVGTIATVWQGSEVEISSQGLTCRPSAALLEAGLGLLPVGVRTPHGPVYPVTVNLGGRPRQRWQPLALALHWDGSSKCRSNRGLDKLGDHVAAEGGMVCNRAFAIAKEFLDIDLWHRMACRVSEGIMKPTDEH